MSRQSMNRQKLRATINRMLREVTIKPTRVFGPEGSNFELLNPNIRYPEKVNEIILQSANALTFRSAVAQLSQATLMLPDTPDYLKKMIQARIIAKTITDPTQGRATAIISAAEHPSSNGKSSPGNYSSYIFAKNSKLGKLFTGQSSEPAIINNPLDSYDDIISAVFKTGATLANKTGDLMEFALCAILSNIAPNKTFFALKGQQQGKDLIVGEDNVTIEAKWSEQKFDSKSGAPLSPVPNKQYNMTPPTPGEKKYFIYITENIEVEIVRSDIMFKYFAVAGEKMPEFDVKTFDPSQQEANMANVEKIITDWKEFQSFLVDNRYERGESLSANVIKFVKNLKLEVHKDYLMFIMRTIFLRNAKGDTNNKFFVRRVSTLENLLQRVPDDEDAVFDLASLLEPILSTLHKLHVVTYAGGKAPPESYVAGATAQMRQKASTAVPTGRSGKAKIATSDAKGVVYHVYSLLKNPVVPLSEKEQIIADMEEKTRQLGKAALRVVADSEAKNLVIEESLKNHFLVYDFLQKPEMLGGLMGQDQDYSIRQAAFITTDSKSPFETAFDALIHRKDTKSLAPLYSRLLSLFGLQDEFRERVRQATINLSNRNFDMSPESLDESKTYGSVIGVLLSQFR